MPDTYVGGQEFGVWGLGGLKLQALGGARTWREQSVVAAGYGQEGPSAV